MKHNIHYKPKAKSKPKANAKSRSKPKRSRSNPKQPIPLMDCLISMEAQDSGFDAMTAAPFVKDMRSDKSKCGIIAINPQPDLDEDAPLVGLLVMIDAVEAKKAKPVLDLAKRNPDKKSITGVIAERARQKTGAALAEDLRQTTENLGESDAAIASVGILASGKGAGLMLFPNNAEAAFLAGLHQGYEIVFRTCPSAKIPGIGLVSKNWRELRSILRTREEIDRDIIRDMGLPGSEAQVSASSKGRVMVTQKGGDLAEQIAKEKAKRKRVRLPRDVWSAYYLGVHIGMLEGYEACPLKWVPFHKGFKKVNRTIRALRDTRKHAGALQAISVLEQQ